MKILQKPLKKLKKIASDTRNYIIFDFNSM